MNISLQNVSKKYGSSRIINELNFEFGEGSACWVSGSNGSGKSTLLKIISGIISPDSGKVIYTENSNQISVNQIHQYISITAPYIDLIEEFTPEELLKFHFGFRKMLPGHDVQGLLELSGLAKYKHRQLNKFSSGMKQRIKLLLGIMSDVPVLLLDEPVSNLDKAGKDWYADLINKYKGSRLVIVCSNSIDEEHFFCEEKLVLI